MIYLVWIFQEMFYVLTLLILLTLLQFEIAEELLFFVVVFLCLTFYQLY